MQDRTPLAPEIESEQAYVVYESATGRIRHIHRITNYRGADVRSRSEDEARALELAERSGHAADGLRVLAVDLSELEFNNSQRVDPKSMRLLPSDVSA